MENSDPVSSLGIHSVTPAESLKEFTLFKKLPPELRDNIWKFGAPGPRLVTVYSGCSFTETEIIEESSGDRTISKTSKLEFKMSFSTKTDSPGMLKACKEARNVIVKLLPLRLPSEQDRRGKSREIRMASHEILLIKNLTTFLDDLTKARKHNLVIPSFVRHLSVLAIRQLFPDMSLSAHLLLFRMRLQKCLPVLENLKILAVFCDREPSGRSNDAVSEYTTNFEPEALTPAQGERLAGAKRFEATFNMAMQVHQTKLRHTNNEIEPKVPVLKIFGKGWPVKQVPNKEETPSPEGDSLLS